MAALLSLDDHPWAGCYFTRNAAWGWHDAGRIDVLDDRGAVLTTLDEWQTLVFHEADGERRVGEFFRWLLTKYPDEGEIPPDLAGTITRVLSDLVDRLGVVELAGER
jgi:hypothetical protein